MAAVEDSNNSKFLGLLTRNDVAQETSSEEESDYSSSEDSDSSRHDNFKEDQYSREYSCENDTPCHDDRYLIFNEFDHSY